MPRAFRLVKRRHARHAFDGEGARLYGGRWNPPGIALVYASQSLSLAALELLVHLDASAILTSYAACGVEFADALVEDLDARRLPRGWRSSPPPSALQALGAAWARERRSAVLRVPSAVVPREDNFLLNPAHPYFRRVTLHAPEPFDLDPRLVAPRRTPRRTQQ
jgi:RES domain-containing protein